MTHTHTHINKLWGKKFIDTLNAGQAAIFFGFGMTKDKRTVIWATQDLLPGELAKKLRDIADVLEGKQPQQ